jgi:hypothetical protein
VLDNLASTSSIQSNSVARLAAEVGDALADISTHKLGQTSLDGGIPEPSAMPEKSLSYEADALAGTPELASLAGDGATAVAEVEVSSDRCESECGVHGGDTVILPLPEVPEEPSTMPDKSLSYEADALASITELASLAGD